MRYQSILCDNVCIGFASVTQSIFAKHKILPSTNSYEAIHTEKLCFFLFVWVFFQPRLSFFLLLFPIHLCFCHLAYLEGISLVRLSVYPSVRLSFNKNDNDRKRGAWFRWMLTEGGSTYNMRCITWFTSNYHGPMVKNAEDYGKTVGYSQWSLPTLRWVSWGHWANE